MNYTDSTTLQPGGTRHGELLLRGQRLTAPMMQNLKTDPVRVVLQLVKYADESLDTDGTVVPSTNGRVHTQPTHFHALQCRAFNAASKSCHSFLGSHSSNCQVPRKYWSSLWQQLHWSISTSKEVYQIFHWDASRVCSRRLSRYRSASLRKGSSSS